MGPTKSNHPNRCRRSSDRSLALKWVVMIGSPYPDHKNLPASRLHRCVLEHIWTRLCFSACPLGETSVVERTGAILGAVRFGSKLPVR
jgi:hypothetical protein